MLHSWSYYPSTLSCSLCLRLERTNTLLVLLVFSTNRAHALDLCLVSMSRYTSSKIWRTFTTPRLHQVKNLDLRAQTHWRYWTLRQSLPWDAWGHNYWSNPIVEVITDLLPVKRDNPGRPVIPISIGMVDFLEALCNFGSSVNIMLRVLYEKFFTHPFCWHHFWARVQDGRIGWQYDAGCWWGWLPMRERLNVTKSTGSNMVPMTR